MAKKFECGVNRQVIENGIPKIKRILEGKLLVEVRG